MFCRTKRFFSTDSVLPIHKTKFNKFVDDQQILYFSCSHILSRDDKMTIKFRASQKTVKWISETQQLPDLHSWRNFQDK